MTDDELLADSIVIVGSPRSGTTMLGKMLEVHSTLCEIVEPRLTWKYGNDKRSDMLRPEHARPDVIAYIRRQFARTVRDAGKERLLEKTPSNALRLEFVDRVLPGCKFIHILRNGYDASLSIRKYWQQAAHGTKHTTPGKVRERLKELNLSRLPYYATEALRRFAPQPLSKIVGQNVWGPRLPGLNSLVNELELLEVCAIQWRCCVEAARQAGALLPADRYREIKLEELTPEKFSELLDFVGLEQEPAVVQHFQENMQPSLSTGRRPSATDEDLATIKKWIEPTMRWLDYDEP